MLIQSAKHFDFHSVAKGVYAAIAREGSGSIANVGFVDIGDSIVVFDSSNTQQAAGELRQIATALTNKPVSHVINSHWHGDHVRGNQIFRDVSIVSTSRTPGHGQVGGREWIARCCDYLRELRHEAYELFLQSMRPGPHGRFT